MPVLLKGKFEVQARIEQKSPDEWPVLMEDVKSVYISENPNAYKRYVNTSLLFSYRPVTVFVYIHRTNTKHVKGQRRTNYAAYDLPKTFEMPDYSVLPKEPDHRRTLYWNPNVKTDKDGKAKVEFYNNSSCKQVVMSAEGITADGRAMVLELKD